MKKLFNDNWQFLDGDNWLSVTVPHTPKIEKLDVCRHFQGKSYYKKSFDLDESYLGKRLVVEFEAIMQYAEIRFNGKDVCVHKGGYLPIYLDITDLARKGENVIEVMADNSDFPDIPPGKPLDVLDFSYFGGIYRNVWLHVTDKVFITLPVMKGKTAGGGVFVTYPSVSVAEATVDVKVNVENAYEVAKAATVKATLSYNGKGVAESVEEIAIEAGSDSDAHFSLSVDLPKLWSATSPNLYDLSVEVSVDGMAVDSYSKKIGIRTLKAENGVFYVNGKPTKIIGTNRHQAFPYIGNAASDEAHERDAYLLKDMGVNFVRLCHYPQSESFLDACDRLGLMVVEPVPGWQWFRDTEEFKSLMLRDAREMLLRDRNHPSIIMWEATLNEAHSMPNEVCRQVVQAIRAEYPGDQCIISGDTIWKDAEFIGLDISHPCPYLFSDTPEKKGNKPTYNGLSYYREFGDWDFGGNYSTSRRGREDGDMGMLLASWNQWHMYNSIYRAPEIIGVANWVGIDYNRGYCPEFPICKCGALDTFRQKKFQYEMYRSQQSEKAMVFVASYWENAAKCNKIVVFSNCDEVELRVNGKVIERRRPEKGGKTEYKISGLYADPYYWVDGTDAKDLNLKPKHANEDPRITLMDPLKLYNGDLMWDGNDCDDVEHAHFLFRNVPYERGYVEAIGYIDGHEVAAHRVNSYGEPHHIEIVTDDNYVKLRANDNDFIFVNARICDENGNTVYSCTDNVEFALENGTALGPSAIDAIAGVATVLVKATDDVKVVATSGNLRGETVIKTVK